MAEAFGNAGSKLGVRCGTSNSFARTLTLHKEKNAFFFYRLPEVTHVDVGVLYYSTIRNFPSVDGFILLEIDNTLTLCLLQMTVARSHPVKYPGLHRILRHVNAAWAKDCVKLWAGFPTEKLKRPLPLKSNQSVKVVSYFRDTEDEFESEDEGEDGAGAVDEHVEPGSSSGVKDEVTNN